MARNTSVSLGEHFTEFVEKQVASGRYATASDVLRAGLRLLERDEEELAWLRARIDESDADIEVGRVHEVNDAYWEMLDKAVDERVQRKQGKQRVAS